MVEESVAVDDEEGGDGDGEVAGCWTRGGAGQDQAGGGNRETERGTAVDGYGQEQHDGCGRQDQQRQDGNQVCWAHLAVAFGAIVAMAAVTRLKDFPEDAVDPVARARARSLIQGGSLPSSMTPESPGKSFSRGTAWQRSPHSGRMSCSQI